MLGLRLALAAFLCATPAFAKLSLRCDDAAGPVVQVNGRSAAYRRAQRMPGPGLGGYGYGYLPWTRHFKRK